MWILGRNLRKIRVYRRRRRVSKRPMSQARKQHYIAHKAEAHDIITTKVAHFAAEYRLTYNKISVRNQTSRWGSCSKKGNLSFNYLVKFLPEHIQNYVVVHELCHLLEFNHSDKFWQHVSRTISEPHSIRQELRVIEKNIHSLYS